MYLGPDFSIKEYAHLRRCNQPELTQPHSVHIDAIATSSFAIGLKKITFGDTDTGNGGQVSDEAIERFAKAAPQLEKAVFNAATRLTDSCLLALTTFCPRIYPITITGHDKRRGGIKGDILVHLTATKTLAPHLRKLNLTDQSLPAKALRASSKARPQLTIIERAV
jgi:hypothetical protein